MVTPVCTLPTAQQYTRPEHTTGGLACREVIGKFWSCGFRRSSGNCYNSTTSRPLPTLRMAAWPSVVRPAHPAQNLAPARNQTTDTNRPTRDKRQELATWGPLTSRQCPDAARQYANRQTSSSSSRLTHPRPLHSVLATGVAWDRWHPCEVLVESYLGIVWETSRPRCPTSRLAKRSAMFSVG